ncbi:uncharacterized protein LOC113348424 [Papaver somniferum]|uniref:uncharacterized protein LOC113348424 n=1 Tax=Papaver somniferum TaxID=3469 RepID=UPI000E6FF199|nr:uncharacterized protein LOC113348424 [Papaver somniferum]
MTSLRQSTEDSDTAMLQVFQFSLIDSAEEWLYFLPPGNITTWGEMKKLFLEKYKKLVASFPHHNISPKLIIQYFYEGLLPEQRNLIDAAAGGSLTEKTISQATSLIESTTSNAQQFYTRNDSNVRRVSEMGESPNTEHQLSTIEKAIHRITSVVAPPYEEEAEFQQPQQAKYQVNFIDDKFNMLMQSMQCVASTTQSLKETVQQNQQKAEQNQLKTDNAIRDFHAQMGQLATDMNLMKAQASTKLP